MNGLPGFDGGAGMVHGVRGMAEWGGQADLLSTELIFSGLCHLFFHILWLKLERFEGAD